MITNEKRVTILYVDDEADNLFAFKAAFRREFEVFTANSGAEGLKILEVKDVQIIIADQRMPETTGVEFFDIVRVKYPDPMRILITAYTDVDAIVDAINKGQIFRYIKKPWNHLEVEVAIKNAYEVYTTRQQLQTKVEELEIKNEELNKFVYSTSHDLRSPLASVMGVLNLAKAEGSVIDPNGYLGMIETCVTKMDFFILKVIEYYRSNRVDDTVAPINFNALIQDSIDFSLMQNPAIRFNIDIDTTTEFRTDVFRLSVILNNLISNAVKYQKPNEPNPAISLKVSVSDAEATILIRDNGIGIKEESLNNIFKMFFRSNFSVTGLGVGLYIVKEALARIGGDIQVESKYGEGTCFKLRIPNHPPIRLGNVTAA